LWTQIHRVAGYADSIGMPVNMVHTLKPARNTKRPARITLTTMLTKISEGQVELYVA